jgi:tRNA1(Val) A37 N6-methylase TrmN6
MSENASRNLTRHDAGDSLAGFLDAAFALLKNGGSSF